MGLWPLVSVAPETFATMAELNWADGEEDKARDAIREVRSDASPTDWCVLLSCRGYR